MSSLNTSPVLDVRGLSPVKDIARIISWAAKNPPGRLWIGDYVSGSSPEMLSWYQLIQRANGDIFHANAQRAGISVRTLVGVRYDVLAPNDNAFITPEHSWEWRIATSTGFPWKDSIKQFEDAGWTYSWPSGFSASCITKLPKETLLYVSSPTVNTVSKHFTLGGVSFAFDLASNRMWIADSISRIAETWRSDILVAVKPWQMNNIEQIVPTSPVSSWGWTGGYIQPVPFSGSKWVSFTGNQLTHIRGLLDPKRDMLTLTRPMVVTLDSLIGPGAARDSVTAEADLRPFSEAI